WPRHRQLGPHRFERLDQVPGERVVVVQHEEAGAMAGGHGRGSRWLPGRNEIEGRTRTRQGLSKPPEAVKATTAGALERTLAIVAQAQQPVVDAPGEPAHAILLHLEAHGPAA